MIRLNGYVTTHRMRIDNVIIDKLDLTTFFLYLSKITSNLPENYLSRSKTTSEKSYSSKK